MRKGAVVLALLVWLGRDSAAAPRAHVASVAAFTIGRAPADEELAYFAPEVTRAVSSALETAGVEVGSGGEWPVAGRMDALDGERVRLSATARGRSLSVEGPVEHLDQLAAQLAQKLAAVLVEGTKVEPKPEAKVVGVRVQPPPVSIARIETKPIKEAAPVAAPAPPSPEPKIEPKPEAKPEIKPEAKPEIKVDPKPDPKIEIKSEPRETMPEVMQAYPGQPGTTSQPNPNPNYRPFPYVTGRVVAHSIPDPPSSYVGTGISATQALYGFLGRRLRLAVVPTGVGLTSPQVAVDEGYRASARTVVMARVDNIEYMPGGEGVSVRLRMQVVVVKEGRVVLRRVIDSPPSDPLRRTDPVYQAVTGALDLLSADLGAAIGGS